MHNPWKARAYLAASTAVTAGTGMPLDTVSYDPNGMVATGATGTARITIPVNGYYMVVGNIYASTPVNFLAEIWKNGAAMTFGTWPNTSSNISMISDIVLLNAADYLQVVPVISGVTTNASAGPSNFLAVHFLSPA